MKLTRIRVKDFRSFSGEHDFEIASGVNFFVGPNNCGKSNLVRALELALDPDAKYDPVKDRPRREAALGAPPTTRITLTFQVGSTQPERTLLDRAQSYEMAVRRTRNASTADDAHTYAADGEIRMVTSFAGAGARQTAFQARGQGAASMSAESPEHQKLERQFRTVVRFGVIHSGEDLESLLKGKFRQILQLVIEDHLKSELAKAEAARLDYLKSLQSELLEPLRQKVLAQVGAMHPEITLANLIPYVPRVDETLSSVEIQLGDVAVTELLDKGTGVRGAVLVSMLQYMAEQSRRSLVMAVEEPEAFLHPGGQEEIGKQLEALAQRSDVSLLVTTHSPYVISRSPEALITGLAKNGEGLTSRAGAASGNEERAELLGSLYPDSGLSRVFERTMRTPRDAKAIVVTEGFTDGHFMKVCCEAAGRADLLEGLHFLPSGGATKLVPQAILARAATDTPVIALLDHDEIGRDAIAKLASLNWNPNKELLSLDKWPNRCGKRHDIEIEDLLPVDAVEGLIKKLGENIALDGKEKCGASWHYRLSAAAKDEAISLLPSLVSRADPGGMVWLAGELQRRAASMSASVERARAFRR